MPSTSPVDVLRQRAFVDGPACADGLFRSAFMNPRRVIGSPLFLEYGDAELAMDGAGGRDGAGNAGCDEDADACGGGGVHGAFFARGMITGRSDCASTEFRNGERVAGPHDECTGGGDGIGGAAPAGSGGTAVETGGCWLNVGTGGGALLLPGVGASCVSQGVLELPDGMSGCATDSGEGVRMWTLRGGAYVAAAAAAAGAVAGEFVVVCVGVGGCDTVAGVGAGNSVWERGTLLFSGGLSVSGAPESKGWLGDG
jgi:hypothetical protein